MKNSFLYSSFFLFIGIMLLSCDSTVSPTDKLQQAPTINSISINPQEISFSPSDGFKDTTVSISIETNIENIGEGVVLGYVIRDKFSSIFIANGDLVSETQSDIFKADINLETTTTSFEEYLVEVYAYNQTGNGTFFQKNFSIKGFSNNRPEIITVNNPDTLIRPESGQLNPLFTAKVSDADGENTLDRVLIRIIDLEVGEPPESPYQMANDGTSFGDISATDSVYTFSFPVTQTENRPNRDFNIEYFAIDKSGLISDTVKTTFSIRGN